MSKTEVYILLIIFFVVLGIGFGIKKVVDNKEGSRIVEKAPKEHSCKYKEVCDYLLNDNYEYMGYGEYAPILYLDDEIEEEVFIGMKSEYGWFRNDEWTIWTELIHYGFLFKMKPEVIKRLERQRTATKGDLEDLELRLTRD